MATKILSSPYHHWQWNSQVNHVTGLKIRMYFSKVVKKMILDVTVESMSNKTQSNKPTFIFVLCLLTSAGLDRWGFGYRSIFWHFCITQHTHTQIMFLILMVFYLKKIRKFDYPKLRHWNHQPWHSNLFVDGMLKMISTFEYLKLSFQTIKFYKRVDVTSPNKFLSKRTCKYPLPISIHIQINYHPL